MPPKPKGSSKVAAQSDPKGWSMFLSIRYMKETA